MPNFRRLPARTLLLVALTGLVAGGTRANAQEPPPPSTLDCGPIRVNVHDFVAVNVGNTARPPEVPAALLVRFLDADGRVLRERRVSLSPGQSATVAWPAAASKRFRQVLVRGEVVVETGPEEPRLRGTVQVFRPGFTYGPHFVCSGDTGGRGPV
jgi:hypothetical protein